MHPQMSGKNMNNRQKLALSILNWHGGQSTPLYALGSSWLGNHEVPTEIIYKALMEIRRIVDSEGICEDSTDKELKSLANKILKASGCVVLIGVLVSEQSKSYTPVGIFDTFEQSDECINYYHSKYPGLYFCKVLFKIGEKKEIDFSYSEGSPFGF